MKAEEFAKGVLEIIQAEPDEIVRLIQNEKWEELEDEIYYLCCSAMEG